MPKKKWYWNDIMDGLLRRLYDPTVRGRSQEIADRLKVPRWAVNRRAAALGLSRPKDRPWSAEDEAYVEASFHHTSVKTLARKLGRSPTAVQLKAKRLGLRKYAEGYTALSLAEALGVDPHWCWPASGRASCGPRVATPSAPPSRAADSWLITDEAVVKFLRDHPYDIDLRKVDSLWFMDLVAPFLQRSATAGQRVEAA